MISILFFLIDLLSFSLFDQWMIYSLLTFFLVCSVKPGLEQNWKIFHLPLILLLFQDFLQYGRFGLILLFLLPAVIASRQVKIMILRAQWHFLPILIGAFFMYDGLLINTLVLKNPIVPLVTICKIFATIIIGYGILWGMLGNRAFLYRNGRKVWTPNR